MSKFSIGEIALVSQSAKDPRHPECHRYAGTEVLIESPEYLDPGMVGCRAYNVQAYDGVHLSVAELVLIKRKPPREDLRLVNWNQCPWRPGQKQRVKELSFMDRWDGL